MNLLRFGETEPERQVSQEIWENLPKMNLTFRMSVVTFRLTDPRAMVVLCLRLAFIVA